MKLNLKKEWFESHLPSEEGMEIGAGKPDSRPEVRCGCCSGMGKVKLGDDLWRTLQRLDLKPKTTEELQEPGVTRNAINNRLIDLESHGLAVCVGKRGKWRMWCRVNASV